ncbi:MAG: dihydrodipicolinate synthase family protein [Planctomycetota bacterium]|jgi:dihydrodipicolinate synthase/N-acetylneuraminate lyase
MTGQTLVLEELLDVLNHKNIIALKDSSGNSLLAQAVTSEEHRPEGVTLLDGNEYQSSFTSQIGYDGMMHGGGVLTCKISKQTWAAVKAGNIEEAIKLDKRKSLCLAAIYNRFSKPLQNTLGQKYALKLLGAFGDEVEVVIDQKLGDTDKTRIEAAVEANKDWLLP